MSKIVNLGCQHGHRLLASTFIQYEGWGKGGDVILAPASSFTFVEYLISWSKIQVIINPLLGNMDIQMQLKDTFQIYIDPQFFDERYPHNYDISLWEEKPT